MSARILIIDDDEVIREFQTRVLQNAGYVSDTAGDADEAREWLSAESYDLVLCDVNLGGHSGLDLVPEIREKWRDTAVVMVTGIDDSASAEMALSFGVYGYLIKPVSANQLKIDVSNALSRRKLELQQREQEAHLERMVEERTRDLHRTIDHLEEVQSKLRHSREETIHRLARAAEFRDNETGHHIERMSRYSALLASRVGLSEQRAEAIRIASPMHDVGKIGVPDAILNKPGRLTPEEFEIMKTHADIGYRILSGSDSNLLGLAATISRTHHERFDGEGYPRGIAGEEIPIEGRICAVADVFDALTSARVYKPAFSIEKAVGIIKEGRGTQFEAALVDAFIGSLDEVLEIRERSRD